MLDRLRLAAWRHRNVLAAIYLCVLLAVGGSLAAYYAFVGEAADRALAIALRAFAFRRSFAVVDRARTEAEEGRPRNAELLLERFMNDHRRSQPATLYYPAVTEASQLLAEVRERLGRPGAAADALQAMIDRDRLDYRTWWRLGELEERRGNLSRARACLRVAFDLSPNHPGVAERYLAVLSRQHAGEEICRVADQFARAAERGRPAVRIAAAGPRSRLVRLVMSWVGIPVEHGDYGPAKESFGLERGRHRAVEIPVEMLRAADSGQELYVQLRFENVYEGLTIDALRYRRRTGPEVAVPLDPGSLSELHTRDSSAAWYAEIRTGIPAGELASLAVVYSCPEAALGASARRAVELARLEVAGRPLR